MKVSNVLRTLIIFMSYIAAATLVTGGVFINGVGNAFKELGEDLPYIGPAVTFVGNVTQALGNAYKTAGAFFGAPVLADYLSSQVDKITSLQKSLSNVLNNQKDFIYGEYNKSNTNVHSYIDRN